MINTGTVQQQAATRRKRPVWPFIVAGVLALCCGLPIAGAGAWFIRETMKVSEGPKYPSIAVGDFIWMGFDPWADSERLFTVVCDKREDKILSQTDDYRAPARQARAAVERVLQAHVGAGQDGRAGQASDH